MDINLGKNIFSRNNQCFFPYFFRVHNICTNRDNKKWISAFDSRWIQIWWDQSNWSVCLLAMHSKHSRWCQQIKTLRCSSHYENSKWIWNDKNDENSTLTSTERKKISFSTRTPTVGEKDFCVRLMTWMGNIQDLGVIILNYLMNMILII